MQRRSVFHALAGLGMTLVGAVSQAQANKVGAPAPDFKVTDSSGQLRSLSDFSGKPVVLEWTSSSCPFARAQYQSGRMPELQSWAKSQGVVWLTILSSHPSRQDYLPAAAAQRFNAKRGGDPTALLMDSDGVMGRRYGAAVANHMFVIDKNSLLVYAGGIDDANSFDLPTVKKSRNHVKAALEDLLAGRPVSDPITKPFGCALAYAG